MLVYLHNCLHKSFSEIISIMVTRDNGRNFNDLSKNSILILNIYIVCEKVWF
jgi:hypothetical protein